MTTKPRELSVDRYNFYATRENPMPEDKIANTYGMSLDELEDWKVKNGLTAQAPVEKKALIKQVSIQDTAREYFQELTVALYEEYKTGEKPLSDTAICKKHVMTAGDMQKFKRENGLLGKFNAHKPGKAIEIKPKHNQDAIDALTYKVAKTVDTATAQLAEKPATHQMERIEVPESTRVAQLKKELELAKTLKTEEIENILASRMKGIEEVYAQEIEKLKAEKAELTDNVAWVENAHVGDTQKIEDLEALVKAAKAEKSRLEEKVYEAERKQRELEVKLSEANGKLARLDGIAERGIRKEKLAKLLMEELTESNQLLESYQDDEGVDFKWR